CLLSTRWPSRPVRSCPVTPGATAGPPTSTAGFRHSASAGTRRTAG
ncbi:hypothetical protein, partial [Arthrobacter sp. DR-2P]